MLTLFIAVIALTLVVSWVCSLLEGFILSITTAEVEALKERHPTLGHQLEHQKAHIERATAAILSLNTLVNTSGSVVIGYLAAQLFGSTGLAILTGTLTLVMLFFCEILPKTIGVLLRRQLAVVVTPILGVVLWLMTPASWISRALIHFLVPRSPTTPGDRQQELLLLVNKAHLDGIFSITEREMIANTLRLDDQAVTSIMTPLERVVALPADEALVSVMRRIGQIPYSRLPVYEGARMIGLVTRDDLLHASALDNHTATVRSLLRPILQITTAATVADLLQHLLKNRQELCIIESPAGQTLGLATMEDIVKHLLGARAS